jgi:hypothetical protein
MGAMATFGPEATTAATIDASDGDGDNGEQSKEVQKAGDRTII